MHKITPFLWFDGQAEEAANFYASLFPGSKVGHIQRSGDGRAFVVDFELSGRAFRALNGGPMFKFTEAFSMFVDCEDQAEVDRYWDALVADGGSESQCGWLKDRFGLSWQIIPKQLMQLLGDPDQAKAGRAMQAMMQMRRLDVATLEAAAASQE